MSILDIFLKIVQIDSESFNEGQMSQYIQEYLKERGVEFRVDDLNQVYARVEGSGELKHEPILFCAHIDTVSPGKGIKPVVQSDGTVTSGGSTVLGADDKVAVATLLWLVDYVTTRKLDSMHTLELVFTVQEEVSPSGAGQLDFDWFSSRVGFVFDKGNEPINCVVTEAGFINDIHIEFSGVGAHASKPQMGKNALVLLSEFITELNDSGKLGVPYPDSTLNFGLIEGGDAINTVPASVKISGDYRARSEEVMDRIKNDIESAKSSVLGRLEGFGINISTDVYCMGYSHNLSSGNYSRLRSVYKSVGFGELKELRTQSGSDASAFNNSGKDIEVFCLGDGVHLMHTVDEYTTVSDLEKLSEIVVELAVGY